MSGFYQAFPSVFLLCSDQRKESYLTSLKRLKVSRDYQTSDFDDGFLQSFYVEEFYKLKYCSTVVYMVPRA